MVHLEPDPVSEMGQIQGQAREGEAQAREGRERQDDLYRLRWKESRCSGRAAWCAIIFGIIYFSGGCLEGRESPAQGSHASDPRWQGCPTCRGSRNWPTLGERPTRELEREAEDAQSRKEDNQQGREDPCLDSRRREEVCRLEAVHGCWHETRSPTTCKYYGASLQQS